MSNATIMIIDPSADTRAMYGEYLRHNGYNVVEVRDTAEALPLAHAVAPDVILTELWLPGLDGIATIRLLRQVKAPRPARIIACSTDIAPVWPYAPPGATVDSAIQKPVSPRAVLTEVQHVLRFAPR